MRFRVICDLIQNRLERGARFPIPVRRREAGIHHEPWNIKRAGLLIAADWPRPETLFAPLGKLRERHRVVRAAPDINGGRLGCSGRSHLRGDKRDEVARMQAVARLKTGSVKTYIR